MVLTLPGGFRAYLFDCDGTIVDSMPLHHLAWRSVLDEWGCELPEELFYVGGRPVADIVGDLNERHGLAIPVDVVARRQEEFYQRSLPELTAVPEVLAHIQAAHGRVPFAVVSGSTRESVTASLTALGLLDRFEVLVCAGDSARAQPDLEGFLLAARQLGIAPADCLVFEDTDLGLRAAAAAGMAAVRVPQPWERAGA